MKTRHLLLFSLIHLYLAWKYQALSDLEIEQDYHKETTIQAPAGTIIGYVKDVEVFGKFNKVARFLGIPYAETPTGNLRFQKPIPRKPFSVPLVAKIHGYSCLQQDSDFLNGHDARSEDCLNLNIYKPEGCVGEKPGEKLAVMVWFHGGGYVSGSSNPYTGDYLAAYGGVIVVTVNYRLSVWGFLSLGDISPGNNGLWDQHLALKWVHQNIEDFGGDRNKVTIFGQSVGAASVVYQSLYEGNTGLFQRVIAQSSSITSTWAFANTPRNDEILLAKFLGCDTADLSKVFKCINSTSNFDLLTAIHKLPGASTMLRMSIIPTVDGKFVKEMPSSILSDNSLLSKPGQDFFSSLDFLSGVTAVESTVHALLLAGAESEDMDHFLPDQNFFNHQLVPLVIQKLFNREVATVILDLVRAHYTNWYQNDKTTSRDNYIHLMCDICHNVPLIQTAQFHARRSNRNTFVYNFNEKPSQQICSTPDWAKGAHHSDELQYVFGTGQDGIMSWVPGDAQIPHKWEDSLSKQLMTMWTNFAKSGNPNHPELVYPEWPQYDLNTQKYLDITRNMTEDSIKTYFHAKSANFWLKIIPAVMEAIEGQVP